MNFSWLTVLLIGYICSTGFSQNLPEHMKKLALTNDEEHFNKTLSVILQPRVVGSERHEAIAEFIKNELDSMGFFTEIDQFSAQVPLKPPKNLTFTNIIGKLNPDAENFLVLACHYDSKYFENNPNFAGAIDSAVPCAINLNIAKTLLPQLREMKKSDISLMMIFFDGEEAFKEWNEADSVYGARHLAQKLAKTPNVRGVTRNIDKIEVLVLLDLVGASNSKFYNFFRNTQDLHFFLVDIERNLDKEGLLEINGPEEYQFIRKYTAHRIDDDHRPFLQKNVPVLHLITTPFPNQWHTENDTADNLNWHSIRNFNKILRIFVHEYLSQHNSQFNFRQ